MADRKTAIKLDQKTARLLDANLNRAREGLRVVEDTARFLWNDKNQYRRIRRLRHQLHRITQASYKTLVDSRDSARDAGRTTTESSRESVSAVVSANTRRAQEALRVLEEFSKVFSPKAASDFKQMRYQLYQEEKRILARL